MKNSLKKHMKVHMKVYARTDQDNMDPPVQKPMPGRTEVQCEYYEKALNIKSIRQHREKCYKVDKRKIEHSDSPVLMKHALHLLLQSQLLLHQAEGFSGGHMASIV